MPDNQKHYRVQPLWLLARARSSARSAAQRAQLRLIDAPQYASQGATRSKGSVAEARRPSSGPSLGLGLDIAKWLVVAALFASAALVTMAPFIML
jgi:hypothetical protein